MNVVLDTNVIVSGILFGGNAREILRLAAQGRIRNHVSNEILAELQEVFARPKFTLTPEKIGGILQLLRETFETVHPTVRISVVKEDPDDDRILEAALTAHADYLVSGDQHLLKLSNWHDIEIVSPAEFLRRIHSSL